MEFNADQIEIIVNEINTNFKECSSITHTSCGSKYPRDKVPIENFKSKKNSDIKNKFCDDCCLYISNVSKKLAKKKKEKVALALKNHDIEIICQHAHHKKNSEYPRDKVPIELFRRDPNDPKSELFTSCKDCRDYLAEYKINERNIKRKQVKENDLFFCETCTRELPFLEQALNKDGSLSVNCYDCHNNQNERDANRKIIKKKIKLEFIEKYECSCYICKKIYLRNENNTLTELNTYNQNGKICVEYFGIFYESKNFINKFSNILEIEILQFDHLTENEQRERGLLLSDEKYIPKKKQVSSLSSEKSMRLESLKCQLVCARCHIIVTITREKGGLRYTKLNREKTKYINDIKLKGCTLCGYINHDLFRFFDFDHIDPSQKFKGISTLVDRDKYTLDEVVTEVSKCRVLCKHCHIIHTNIHKRNYTRISI